MLWLCQTELLISVQSCSAERCHRCSRALPVRSEPNWLAACYDSRALRRLAMWATAQLVELREKARLEGSADSTRHRLMALNDVCKALGLS